MADQTKEWLEFLKPAPHNASATLLTIPGELRNRIYELCLVEDKDVYPYDYKPCGCDCPKSQRVAPSISLLSVNRQINTEATALLYGSVNFHLETGFVFMRFSSPSDHICMFTHPNGDKLFPSRHFIRSLTFKFIPEILERGPQASRTRDFWEDDSFRTMSTRRKAQAIHEYSKSLSETVWEQAAEVISEMRGLQNLKLDIDKVFCPQGCCRLVGHVIKALKGLKKREGLKLTVVGNMLGGEVKKVVEGLKYDASLGDSTEEDHDLDEDMDEDVEEDSTEEDSDREEGSSATTDSEESGDDAAQDDDMPGLSEFSVDSDMISDMEDSLSDLSSVSTISIPTNMFDTGSSHDKSTDVEEDSLAS